MREFRYFEAPGLAMLRRLVLAAVAALALAAPASAGTTVAAATFVFSGHGWGHGIGLSQYGALGYAQHGSTYTQIAAFGVVILALATAAIVYTFYKQVWPKPAYPYDLFPLIIASWAVLGAAITFAFPALTRRIGRGLAEAEGMVGSG